MECILFSTSTPQRRNYLYLPGKNIIYTTAELVVGESKQLQFKREKDGTTEWEELQVKENKCFNAIANFIYRCYLPFIFPGIFKIWFNPIISVF